MNLIDKLKYRGTPYLELGGKSAIDRIVDEFYEIMDSDPLAKECRGIHATSLEEANQKAKTFSLWMVRGTSRIRREIWSSTT